MQFKANDIIKAIRDAYYLASAHRCRAAVIVETGKLKAVTRPSSGDSVLIGDIVPPTENKRLQDAARQAMAEFPDAEPALRRMIEIAGVGRSPADRAACFEAMIREFEMQEQAREMLDRDAGAVKQVTEPSFPMTAIRALRWW